MLVGADGRVVSFYICRMIRRNLLLLLLLLHGWVNAQENTPMILVPYQPEFYLSDAERDIMASTEKTPDSYRQYFRKTLDLKLQAELETLAPCHSLLQDTSAAGRSVLEGFYDRTRYSYQDPVGPRVPQKNETQKKNNKFTLFNDPNAVPQTITTRGDSKFMEAEPADTAWLSALAARHQAGLIICINQFEIKTNYNSCIDIANKIYRREIIVHYSILRPNGKQLRGNFLMEFFPSNSNRDSDIAEKSFPQLAVQLRKQVEEALGLKTKK